MVTAAIVGLRHLGGAAILGEAAVLDVEAPRSSLDVEPTRLLGSEQHRPQPLQCLGRPTACRPERDVE